MVGKVYALQAQALEFSLQNPYKRSQAWKHILAILALDNQRWQTPGAH